MEQVLKSGVKRKPLHPSCERSYSIISLSIIDLIAIRRRYRYSRTANLTWEFTTRRLTVLVFAVCCRTVFPYVPIFMSVMQVRKERLEHDACRPYHIIAIIAYPLPETQNSAVQVIMKKCAYMVGEGQRCQAQKAADYRLKWRVMNPTLHALS